MAVPVGNLLRKLKECLDRVSDPLIRAHLNQIHDAFDKAMPLLHDAERTRARELKQEEEGQIGKWVTQVSALAVEVENGISSYELFLRFTTVRSRLLYLYFRVRNDNSGLAKIWKFLNDRNQFTSFLTCWFPSNRDHSDDAHGVRLFAPDESSSSTAKSATSWPMFFSDMDLPELLWRFTEKIESLRREALNLNLIQISIDPNPYFEYSVRNFLRSTSMVGRRDEVKKLENWLLEGEKSDRDPGIVVIGVTGEAGIGKTTIVKAIYERLRHQFDCHAWVFVSTSLSKKVLFLREMLKGVLESNSVMLPSNLNSMDNVSLLEKMIQKHLVGKKFLLVLDDILAPDDLKIVKAALPGDCRAKIIVTSRTNLSPPLCQRVLPLDHLPDLDAYMLLLELVPEITLDENLRGRSIPNPLAIMIIGGLLSTKKPYTEEFVQVLNMLEDGVDLLPLCYADLDSVLKSCFLYAASLPLHLQIPCNRLLRLWLAEGFVPEDADMTKEDAVRLCLTKLINRNLIQLDRVGIDGEMETCRVLRPMREFALKISSEQRQLISTTLVVGDSSSTTTAILPADGPYRLFLSNNFDGSSSGGINEKLKYLGRVRTLISLNGSNPESLIRALTSKANSFILLRVLEILGLPVEDLPDEVLGHLRLLRYLGLRGTRLKKLPKSLMELQSLQTLDIRDTFVKDLPAGLESLKVLRHLLLAGSFGDKVVNLEAEIENFGDLQTLAGLKLTQKITKGLSQLLQLRKLSVGEVQCFFAKDLLDSINQMKFLHSLTVKCARDEKFALEGSSDIPHTLERCTLKYLKKLRIGGQVTNLTDLVKQMENLKYLYVWDNVLGEDSMTAIQHLPNLVLLSLCNAYDGEELNVSATGFPNLKKLSILHCKRLKSWTEVKDGSMEMLETLTIAYCPQLSKVPKGLEELPCLQNLHLSHIPEQFIDQARKIPTFSIHT